MFDGDRKVQAQSPDERERVRACRPRAESAPGTPARGSTRTAVARSSSSSSAPRDDHDAFVGQRRPHRVEENVRVPAGDLLCSLADAAQLFAAATIRRPNAPTSPSRRGASGPRRAPYRTRRGSTRRWQGTSPASSSGRDVSAAKGEHPGIELQPAQLAVEVAILRQRVVDRRRGCRRRRLRGAVAWLLRPNSAGHRLRFAGSDLGFGFGHLTDDSLLTSCPATAMGHPVARCSPGPPDGLRRRGANTEPPRHQ